jgi:hypothetical protein
MFFNFSIFTVGEFGNQDASAVTSYVRSSTQTGSGVLAASPKDGTLAFI